MEDRNECYPSAPPGPDPLQPGRREDNFKPSDRRGPRKDWVDARNEMIQAGGARRAELAAKSGTIGHGSV